jgi:hypothetical protein
MIGEACRHQPGVVARVVESAAAQISRLMLGQAVVGRVESRMLPGENQPRTNAASGQRLGDGGKLDGFGSGADDQPYFGKTQSSP